MLRSREEETPDGQVARVAYILRSFPRLSQTFILNEILALEQLGLKLHIFALTDPREAIVQDGVADVRAPTEYLESAQRRPAAVVLVEHLRVAITSPRRYLGTAAYVLRRSDLDAGYTASSRFACFIQAVRLARMLRRGTTVTHVHAHFAHDPTLIALLLKKLTGIGYSFTAHARDLYQIPPASLAERMAEARAVVTCCRANLDYLNDVAPDLTREKARVIHHGIDLDAFRPPEARGSSSRAPLILSVGRLVEKKGFPDLIAACALLKQAGHRFRCEIYGEGPLYDELVRLIARFGAAERVIIAGARTQEDLAEAFRAADVFALTPVVTDDGDRDGIPNVLVEAMACGLPVVSTPVGGIPEVVIHCETGLLAEPHDPPSIAGHLAALLVDAGRRRRLGAAARRAVVNRFDTAANARALAAVLERGATRR